MISSNKESLTKIENDLKNHENVSKSLEQASGKNGVNGGIRATVKLNKVVPIYTKRKFASRKNVQTKNVKKDISISVKIGRILHILVL